jgi:NAD(P)-dependent dehydrogenase (short-subunit alcohol dehydrogenase family)
VQRRVVLVTGGSRGIGASVCRQAAAAGWAVCLTYRADADSASAVVGEIEAAGGVARAVRADMASDADVVAAFEAACTLGPLGGVVCNAGIVAPKARVDELTAGRVERMLAVNVFGPIMCCREAVRRMSTRHGAPGGSIVLVSSASSRLGSAGEYVDYAASKGAVDSLGLGVARETGAEGIRVNVVRPGVVDTEIHASSNQPDRAARQGATAPMGRPGQPDEIAAAIVWLLSDAASYTTGAILDVSGGR